MSLITKLPTDMPSSIATTRKRQQDEIIKAAQENAFHLAVDYNVPSFKYNDKLGICYLTWARKTRAGISTTYTNEAAIINAYNNTIEANNV